jgi:diacylglycerol kinase (ATP)
MDRDSASGKRSPVDDGESAAKIVQIVVTPGSGEGRAMGTARRLRRLLKRRGWDSNLQSFSNLTVLLRWAKTCSPDFSHLVCVGGDSTLSAAAAAAVRSGVPFVPVGNGFGNVFTRVFGHPDRAEAVVELLEHGEVRKVDVGIANDAIFLSHRSYGFLEQIQQAAERGRKQPRNRLLRYVWYYGVAMHFLLRTRLASIRVEIDDRLVAEDAVLVTVANVGAYRGWLSLTPAASPIDGMFDVFLVRRVSKVGLVWRLLKLMFRLSGCWQGVALYRGRRVVVTTPTRQEKLWIQRRALPLLLPPGAIESLRQRTVNENPPAATVS